MCPSSSTHSATRPSEDIGRPAATAARRSDETTGLVRASDAEREAATAELRAHAAAGRLDVDELETRIGAVLSSRTRAEVAATLADLPGPEDAGPIAPRRRPAQPLHTFAWVMALLLAIWLLTGAGHFWPLYPALGWGVPLLLGRGCAMRRQTPARP